MPVRLDTHLGWRDVAAVAEGVPLELGPEARRRIAYARTIVDAIVAQNLVVYGINTGVGALCDTIVPPDQQRALSRNIVFSHAVGVGPTLPDVATRAIMAAAINNHALGHSGVRPVLVDTLLALLNRGCTPEVPAQGSVGYLSHMAHVALVVIGEGSATLDGAAHPAGEALRRIDLAPLVLEAKEGLSIVNGTPCATGLACLALARAERLLDWADACAALTFESLDGQVAAFDADAMALHRSPGVQTVAATLRALLSGSERLSAAQGKHLQDPLSLRAVPHVHGAARDAFAYAAGVVDRELGSVTDNPLILGTPEHPRACSTAHAVGSGVALAMDTLAIAVAEVAAMAERRIDRLVNPLVNGLPAFLARRSGVRSGFMIAHYTAVSLANDNRRLAMPASLDGGITSGLQEDHLSHATPASLKCLSMLENAQRILGIELLAGVQAADLRDAGQGSGPGPAKLRERVRALVPPFDDDRPLATDIEQAACLIGHETPDQAIRRL